MNLYWALKSCYYKIKSKDGIIHKELGLILRNIDEYMMISKENGVTDDLVVSKITERINECKQQTYEALRIKYGPACSIDMDFEEEHINKKRICILEEFLKGMVEGKKLYGENKESNNENVHID